MYKKSKKLFICVITLIHLSIIGTIKVKGSRRVVFIKKIKNEQEGL